MSKERRAGQERRFGVLSEAAAIRAYFEGSGAPVTLGEIAELRPRDRAEFAAVAMEAERARRHPAFSLIARVFSDAGRPVHPGELVGLNLEAFAAEVRRSEGR